MDKSLLDKIQVVRTHNLARKFDFPEEGYFVGASNCNYGPNEFKSKHLYYPDWTKHGQCTWGGYTEIDENEEPCPRSWWTFGAVYDHIETDYLYYCENKETAEELCKFLNNIPSKHMSLIDYDIEQLKKQIKEIETHIQELEDSKEIAKELYKKAE